MKDICIIPAAASIRAQRIFNITTYDDEVKVSFVRRVNKHCVGVFEILIWLLNFDEKNLLSLTDEERLELFFLHFFGFWESRIKMDLFAHFSLLLFVVLLKHFWVSSSFSLRNHPHSEFVVLTRRNGKRRRRKKK